MNRSLSTSILTGGLLLVAGMVGIMPAAIASNGPKEQAAMERTATSAAARAQKALSDKKLDRAIEQAERAVAAMPYSADYRFLLGDAYLTMGRFTSAETAYSDALTLKPDHSKAALKLALVKIALNHAAEARELLETHRSTLDVSDYGLALALSGGAEAAADVLGQAVRAGEANSKTRQNLALAYALSGRWEEARTTASMDLPPDTVTKRLSEWAALAQPGNSGSQVASLLGVIQMEDQGQPSAIALAVAPSTALAAATDPRPQTWFEPAEPVQPMVAANDVAPEIKDPARVRVTAEAQAVDKPKVKNPDRAQLWANALRGTRRYVVQIGAFKSSQAAATGWSRASARWTQLKSYDARQARIQLAQGGFYRLSVGGFSSRGEAVRVCTSLRTSGGQCFIRELTSSDSVKWARRDTGPKQLASR